ncbi:MAG: sulfatase-like hydrolase/transferase [Caldilineaceae bacterium]|nr:sulfatase-like hydrolase/transferase [Caldilineaceae bacterium]
MDRRRFLRMAAGTSAALLTADAATRRAAQARQIPQPAAAKPNILVIVVDQMRYPQWFPDQATLDTYLPNLARLRQNAVDFTHHYAAATACTPSRACMLTGLYGHQHFCLITQTSHLHPDFPTWGDYLRSFGYDTHWFGKWHLSEDCGDDDPPYTYLEPYGFNTYTCPDPHGAPGQGLNTDDDIANQFADWLANPSARAETPWCATVSFVNPHDIMFYPRFTDHIAGEDSAPSVFSDLPPNFETAQELQTRGKPTLQQELIKAANRQFGAMSYTGANAEAAWIKMLDTYLLLHQYVDQQIGVVLDALDAQPAVKGNTVVIFTCDHGDYCGSHGLRGKGGAVYEESTRVPFTLQDHSGLLGVQPGQRTQLTSHVDLAPLLMTIAYGGSGWRALPECQQLASRLDMLAIATNPGAAGRSYVLHTTDEPGTEEKVDVDYQPFAGETANHVIAYRTAAGKLATYSHWVENSIEITTDGQEVECYDYGTDAGRKEIDNIHDSSHPLYSQLMDELVSDAIPTELRAPLPSALQQAQQEALTQYLTDIGQLGYRLHLPIIQDGSDS